MILVRLDGGSESCSQLQQHYICKLVSPPNLLLASLLPSDALIHCHGIGGSTRDGNSVPGRLNIGHRVKKVKMHQMTSFFFM